MPKFSMVVLLAAFAGGCGNSDASAQIQNTTVAPTSAMTSNTPVGTSFEISAASLGGCEAAQACPSYRISTNGSYQYTQPGFFGGPEKNFKGTLSAQESLALSQLLTQDRLSQLEASQFSGTCPSFNDGTDYAFEVTLDGHKTMLHSCQHALADDALGAQLIGFFDAMARNHEE